MGSLTDQYIWLHDYEEAQKKPEKRVLSGLIFVRKDQVAAILPRRSCTTLIVSGKYLHVTETVVEIEALLDR